MTVRIEHGDCLDVLPMLAAEGVRFDAVVCDPPYGLEFMGKEWDAPWQTSSKSALFGNRQVKTPGFGVTRNPNCTACGGRLRGAKKCGCETPAWDEAPTSTRLRQMAGFQGWCQDWAEAVFAVMKPGAFLVAFGGTRTYHRMACAIEDAGFEIRDTLAWLYGSGFPKSHDVSKAIDKALGAEGTFGGAKTEAHQRYIDKGIMRGDAGHDGWQRPWMDDAEAVANAGRRYIPATAESAAWDGWGTALKPAYEPIILARKPLIGTVAANVLQHGTGALNIDGCRVPGTPEPTRLDPSKHSHDGYRMTATGADCAANASPQGRWPANVVHDGSDEVVSAFPVTESSLPGNIKPSATTANAYGEYKTRSLVGHVDAGSAARFFYSAKADADDRAGSKHPTVKPLDLMRWLCRLVTPPKGLILDLFAGTGSTGEAARLEGFRAVLIEREAEYIADIHRRLARAAGGDTPLFATPAPEAEQTALFPTEAA